MSECLLTLERMPLILQGGRYKAYEGTRTFHPLTITKLVNGGMAVRTLRICGGKLQFIVKHILDAVPNGDHKSKRQRP
jgi:hypothetical protein